MAEFEKLQAFGQWLVNRREVLKSELAAIAADRTKPPAAIRIKAGHVEDTTAILMTFKELYEGDLNKFRQDHLGIEPETEEGAKDDSNPE